ncbi:TPA: hypothetical protein ACONHB_002593 [Staphylococcus aureus]
MSMIFFSLNAYPKDEVMEYISEWDNIGSFVILIIMYAMLFPIFTIPFLGDCKNKRYFLEKNNNEVIEREIIDRVYINRKDKLTFKTQDKKIMDSNGRYTKNLFKIPRQKQKRESPFLFLYVVFQQFI